MNFNDYKRIQSAKTMPQKRRQYAHDIFNQTFDEDAAYRQCYIYDYEHDDHKDMAQGMSHDGSSKTVIDTKYLVTQYGSLSKDQVEYHLVFRYGQEPLSYYSESFGKNAEFPIGLYVDVPDENGVYRRWMICSRDVMNDQIVTGSSLVATVAYEQENGEPLDSYRFCLYNEIKQEIAASETATYQDYISYIYKGFENMTSYYVRCQGVTVNGIPLDTGYVMISVYFSNPGDYKLIYATNYPYRGYNTYSTNIKIIDCDDYQTDRYQYDNGFVDLLDDEITYSSNFNIDNDFTLMIRGKCMYQEAEIFSATNGKDKFEIRSYIYDDETLRYRLTAHNAHYEYMLYSEAIPKFGSYDLLTMWVQRKENYFEIVIYIKPGNGIDAGMWFGIPNPVNGLIEHDIWINSDEPTNVYIDKEDVIRYADAEEPDAAPQYAIWIGGD